MKRSDALPSASRSLQAEVGVAEFSVVPAYNPKDRNFELDDGINNLTCYQPRAAVTVSGLLHALESLSQSCVIS